MNDELKTDDEMLREIGATEGQRKIAGISLRPMTVLTLSQMQRNGLLDETTDMLQKTAAFAFIHSAPKDDVRSVVNNRAKFFDEVDEWLERNFTHHAELEPLAEMMAESFNAYMAAKSSGGGVYQGDGSKN
jgi:hypothetical protein